MIKRHKFNAKKTGETKSLLERNCIKYFEQKSLPFQYEPFVVELLKPFQSCSIEITKGVEKTTCSNRAITYKPDFVWEESGKWLYVIEAKGMKTPDFQIKWKLFKQWLSIHHPNCIAVIIHSLKDLAVFAESIKTES